MASFLLFEIRNILRLEGFEVNKYTNRRVICNLLGLKKNSTLFSICENLKMSYMKRGDFEYKDSKKFFLHFLNKETTWSFESMAIARKRLGISFLTYEKEKVLEKIILINGEKAVLSFNSTIDRSLDFSPCMENKININLALSLKLGYNVDHDISIPEIFSILGEKIPNHKLKQRLCQLLLIPYYFEKEEIIYNKNIKVLAKTTEEEILVFNSLRSAGKFFQIDGSSIRKVIEKKYRLPFWFKRYTLELA